MELFDQTILITVLTAVVILVLATRSGQAKQKAGLKPYDQLTDETARIADRIHLNTVEMTVVFLPLFWIASLYAMPSVAVALGWVWLLSRVGYAYAYSKDPKRRGNFFFLNFFSIVGLILVIFYILFFNL